jgi:hypothetical protein
MTQMLAARMRQMRIAGRLAGRWERRHAQMGGGSASLAAGSAEDPDRKTAVRASQMMASSSLIAQLSRSTSGPSASAASA